jgi:acetyl esterase/lipase
MKRRWPLLIAALAIPAVLAACSPVGALNALTFTSDLQVEKNLTYGPDPRNVLDIYAPKNAAKLPLVLFIHGGGWTAGNKDEYTFVGDSLARAGYVTAVINYRLAPQNRYPAYVQDAALATRWLRDHARSYGADPDKLFVTGHSAGAFNAMELVMNERWLREAGVPIQSVRGVVGVAGPYDYDFREFPSKNAFPAGGDPADIMPSRHVRKDPPPTLLLVAERDQVVERANADKMLAALQAAGDDVTLQVLPRVDHYTSIGAISRNLTFLGGTRQAVLDFLQKRR